MSASYSTVLVPSQLPEDAEAWVRTFATRLRDEVARPLFGASDAETFHARLPDCLARGAILRFRWLNALSERPSDESAELANEWMRPPPPALLGDLQRRAAVLLGDERSFQVQRALAMMFTDAVDGVERVITKWRASGPGPWWIVEMARLAEAGAPHDVFAITWIAVLLGDLPPPSPEVADAAAAALLDLTAVRLTALQAVIRDEIPVREPRVDDRAFPVAWCEGHPTLVSPMLLLVGLALDDPELRSISLSAERDPEDPDLSVGHICLHVEGDGDQVRLRIEARATRAGILGVMTDDHGGILAITTAPSR